MGMGQNNFFFFWDTFESEEKRVVFGQKLTLILKYFKTHSSYEFPIKNKS